MERFVFLFLFFLCGSTVAHATVSGGTIDLSKTGQTICYNSSGTTIDCVNTGQDGDLRGGLAWPNPRFTDNGDGTVTDNLTGLIWLKNAHCASAARNWTTALADVASLNSAGTMNGKDCGDTSATGSHQTDWRLPNLNELKSLVNVGQSNSATWLVTQGFSGVQSGNYWSGSSDVNITSYAWIVNMGYGFVNSSGKFDSSYVWPVRAGEASGSSVVQLPKTGQTICYNSSGTAIDCIGTGQDGNLQKGVAWPDPRFTDNGDGTVTDNLTGLIWLKNAHCASVVRNWATALADVASLNSVGTMNGKNCDDTSAEGSHQTDWRLPNVNELKSLVNVGQSNSGTWLATQGFSNVQSSYYWSGTSYTSGKSSAWSVHMSNGYTNHNLKSLGYYGVWPVRAGASLSGITVPMAPSMNVETSGINVTITWSNVPTADGYTLFYAPYPAGAPINSMGVETQTSFSITLYPSASYYLAVKAYNSYGSSDYSNIVYFSLVSAPTGFSVSMIDSSVSLTWNAVSGAAGYKLYYGTTSGSYSGSTDLGGVTSKFFTEASPPPWGSSGTYYLAIVAYDVSSAESAKSTEKIIISKPTGLSATASGTTVSLTWSAVSGADGYKLYYGTSSGSYLATVDLGNVTSKSFTGVPPGTYYLAITAYGSSSTESAKSTETNVIVTATTTSKDNFGGGVFVMRRHILQPWIFATLD